jgi:hypothetical protein
MSRALAGVVSLFATVALLLCGVQAPTASAAPLDPVNIAGPNVPMGVDSSNIPVLDRNCAPQQVDINTADVRQIGAALNISSDLVLKRIADARPFLRAVDAVSVPGVGPELAPRLMSGMCASPLSVSTKPSNACLTGTRAVDLQRASVDEMVKVGIAADVAGRLASSRPLPDALTQIASPRVPGFSLGLIERLVSTRAVCVSPAPFTYAGKTQYWIESSKGGVARAAGDPRYALYIPPGRIVDAGAWASVTVLPLDRGYIPQADFHIEGAWLPEVVGQLPMMEGANAQNVLVLHHAADGPRLSSGPNIFADGDGTVRFALRSLSVVQDMPKPAYCDPAFENLDVAKTLISPGSMAICDTSTDIRDMPFQAVFERRRDSVLFPQFAQTGPCPTSDNASVNVTGNLYGLQCDGAPQVGGEAATSIWTNDSSAFLLFGNVYAYSVAGPGSVARRAPTGGGLTQQVFSQMSETYGDVPPSAGLAVVFTRGETPTTVTVSSSPYLLRYWAIANATSLLDIAGVGASVSCGAGLAWTGVDADSIVGCITALGTAALKAMAGAAAASLAEVFAVVTFAIPLAVTASMIAQEEAEKAPVSASFEFQSSGNGQTGPGSSQVLDLGWASFPFDDNWELIDMGTGGPGHGAMSNDGFAIERATGRTLYALSFPVNFCPATDFAYQCFGIAAYGVVAQPTTAITLGGVSSDISLAYTEQYYWESSPHESGFIWCFSEKRACVKYMKSQVYLDSTGVLQLSTDLVTDVTPEVRNVLGRATWLTPVPGPA